MPSEKSVTSRKPARRLNPARPAGKHLQGMPPLFLTKKLRKTIERLLPIEHHQRLRQYFDIYGCLHCSRRAVVYGANGFCGLCISMLGKRIRKIDKELQSRKPVPPPKLEEIYLRSYNSARELLADLKPRIGKRPIRGKPDLRSLPKVYVKF